MEDEIVQEIAPEKSKLIPIIAWSLILYYGFLVLTNLPMLLFSDIAEYNNLIYKQIQVTALEGGASGLTLFFISNTSVLIVFNVMLAIAVLAGAVGLLQKAEWAKTTLLTALSISIVFYLLSALTQPTIMKASMKATMALQMGDPAMAAMYNSPIFNMIPVILVVFMLVMVAIYGWIIYKVNSIDLNTIEYSDSVFIDMLSWSILVPTALIVVLLLFGFVVASSIAPGVNVAIIVFLIIFGMLLFGSYGLLKRKNWSRIFYTVVFVLGTVLLIIAEIGIYTAGPEMNAAFAEMPNNPYMGNMANYLLILYGSFALVLVLFTYKINTKKIVAEFKQV